MVAMIARSREFDIDAFGQLGGVTKAASIDATRGTCDKGPW